MAKPSLFKRKEKSPSIFRIFKLFPSLRGFFQDLCRGGELFERITQGELGGEAQVRKSFPPVFFGWWDGVP